MGSWILAHFPSLIYPPLKSGKRAATTPTAVLVTADNLLSNSEDASKSCPSTELQMPRYCFSRWKEERVRYQSQVKQEKMTKGNKILFKECLPDLMA